MIAIEVCNASSVFFTANSASETESWLGVAEVPWPVSASTKPDPLEDEVPLSLLLVEQSA